MGQKGKGGKTLHIHTPIDIPRGEKAPSFDLKNDLVQEVSASLDGNEPTKALALASLKGLQEMDCQSERVKGGTIYLNQSCKQNIDRGVAVNVATILFADVISEKKLTQERVHQVVGMVLARPGMVDDRAVIGHRLDPLVDLLQAMENRPGLTTAIQAHFCDSAISFEPST